MSISMAGRGRGFTLIELMIAIAIMSAVLLALYSSFLLAGRAMFQAGDSSVRLQESRAFVDTLKRELEAVRYSRDNSFCVFKIDDRDFYGRQASSLTMTTTTPLIKGMAKINYTVEEQNGRLVITKSMASAFSGEAKDNRINLVEDIESFTVQAKYRDDTWVKTWDGLLANTAPAEVKITLTMRRKSNNEEESPAARFSVFATAKLMVGRTL